MPLANGQRCWPFALVLGLIGMDYIWEPLAMQKSLSAPSTLRYLAVRLPFVALTAAVLAWIPGCPASITSNQATGKVTTEGKIVDGEVTFIGADNKQKSAPIGPDGIYTILDPPQGNVKIIVKGRPGVPGLPPGGDKGPAAVDVKKGKDFDAVGFKDKGGTLPIAVPPPKKYENPETSGLTKEVKPGKNENMDLNLTP